MLLTARVSTGPAAGRGVIGHARSPDLLAWSVQPPLSEPAGFGWLEVPQVHTVDGQPVLVFSCWADRSVPGGPARGGARGDDRAGAPGGMWTVPGATLLGPWDLDRAEPLRVPSLYAGHLVRERDGSWAAMGFRDGPWERFSGSIGDPIPVRRYGTAIRVDAG
jgi:beta-fructofuranosidase